MAAEAPPARQPLAGAALRWTIPQRAAASQPKGRATKRRWVRRHRARPLDDSPSQSSLSRTHTFTGGALGNAD